jgi:hypothetical protein
MPADSRMEEIVTELNWAIRCPILEGRIELWSNSKPWEESEDWFAQQVQNIAGSAPVLDVLAILPQGTRLLRNALEEVGRALDTDTDGVIVALANLPGLSAQHVAFVKGTAARSGLVHPKLCMVDNQLVCNWIFPKGSKITRLAPRHFGYVFHGDRR